VAQGDEIDKPLPPVINVKKEGLKKEGPAKNEASLPPVFHHKKPIRRDSSAQGSGAVPIRNTIGPTDTASPQPTVRPPVLAPVIRGRPPGHVQRDPGLEMIQQNRILERTEPKRISRPAPTRDRSAMNLAPNDLIPPSVPNSVARVDRERALEYGEPSQLLNAVTIDLEDHSPMVALYQESSRTVPVPASLNPVLLDQKGFGIAPRALSTVGASGHHHPQLTAVQPPQQPATSPSDRPEVLPEAAAVQPDPESPMKSTMPGPSQSEEVFRSIQQIRVDIAPKGDLPPNRAAMRFARAGEQFQATGYSREEVETQFAWEAPAMCHRPLFFEDINLERHGYHVKHIQPFLSAAHFFSRVPAMPYLAMSERSRVCNYTLGHYQPGSSAPYLWYYPRLSLTGVALEGALVTSLILAIP
jgi:hypothetical protein